MITISSISNVRLRAGKDQDLPFIREKSGEWLLDDEDLDAKRFLIAEGRQGGILGFGRIKKYPSCYELGTVGVSPDWRGCGLGKAIIKALIAKFPSDQVWITTDMVAYFEKLGFRAVEKGPKELMEKIASTCRTKGRQNVKLMLLRRKPR